MERPELPDLNIRNGDHHREVRRHAKVMGQWISYTTYLEHVVQHVEEQLEFLTSGLRKVERENLVARYGKSGVTERAINDEVMMYVEVKRKMTRLRHAVRDHKAAKGIVASLEWKGKLLQSYVGLLRSELDRLNRDENTEDEEDDEED